MTLRATLRRLFGGGEGLPAGFPGRLEPDERVVAVAHTADGGPLVVTSWGLWVPAGATRVDGAQGDAGADAARIGAAGPAVRRIGWHLVSRAVWRNGVLAVVEADEVERLTGDGGPEAVLLADRPPRRIRLADPGRVPEVVHARVEGSIHSRHHRDLPGSDLVGGGAWFVQRKVPGRDGTVLQVRPDPGTDPALVAQIAADVARALIRP